MKLHYHKGQNFGDALNPLIWNSFLPNFFDNDESVLFVGFGTLLGFDFPKESKKIVFSTGGALDNFGNYGELNIMDKSWEIKCVRGPLTAKAIGISEAFAVTDGAVLIREITQRSTTKTYKVSYMPHVASMDFYNLESLCDSLGIHFINPKSDCLSVIQELNQSELVICEAMHGAIVADALDVPWVPFKMFRQVNEFKWNDWARSLEMRELNFKRAPELYNKKWLVEIIQNKIPFKGLYLSKIFASIYLLFQESLVKQRVKFSFKKASKIGQLSKREVLEEKISILKSKLTELKNEYS